MSSRPEGHHSNLHARGMRRFVHNNQLTALPPEMGKLASLRELYASCGPCALAHSPKGLERLRLTCHARGVRRRVTNNKLTALPHEFAELYSNDNLYGVPQGGCRHCAPLSCYGSPPPLLHPAAQGVCSTI